MNHPPFAVLLRRDNGTMALVIAEQPDGFRGPDHVIYGADKYGKTEIRFRSHVLPLSEGVMHFAALVEIAKIDLLYVMEVRFDENDQVEPVRDYFAQVAQQELVELVDELSISQGGALSSRAA